MNITTDDLMDALQAALGPMGENDNGKTVQDIVAETGWGTTVVRKNLANLQRQGRLEVVRVKRPALDGRQCSVPAYRMRAA